MINRREKLQLFNKLRGTGHAEADLALLKEVNPRHPKLTRFSRDPKRYADEILYALLDECDEEDIVDYRIYFEKLNENINENIKNTSDEGEQEPEDGSSNTSAEGEQEPEDGSSNTSTEEEQGSEDGSSNTSTEEETSEGESQQESEQPDAADPGGDSKKK